MLVDKHFLAAFTMIWSDRLTATQSINQRQNDKIMSLILNTLEAIDQQELTIQAWEFLDPGIVMAQVNALEAQQSDQPLPLYGVPIAIKDIFATADMPTGWGTPIHQGRMLNYDAAVVERLRRAGAIILGKTVTTEYATARPGKTCNPRNPDHTPGGSSSGSAAAVAAGMVPLALGSQTLGSILRPAAYCGVLGFKPSFGSISRYGVMPACRELDHVGVFGHTVADIQLLCSVLAVPDGRDPDCCGNSSLQQLPLKLDGDLPPNSGLLNAQAATIRLALWKTPFWDLIEPEGQQRLFDCAQLLEQAGAIISSIELPPEFADSLEDAQILMSVGLAVNHGMDYDTHFDQLSPKMRKWIERGRQVRAIAHARIRQKTVEYSLALAKIFAEYDAILMPVTTGTAPATLEETGSPVLCALSTLCGLPSVSIPAGRATNGLPLAVQLMGQRWGDRALLQIADWVQQQMVIFP